MIEITKPTKFTIFKAEGKYTAAQVRDITGADMVINGGLYNMSNMKPVENLRIDKQTLSKTDYTVIGYGWNKPEKVMHLASNSDIDRYDYFISCILLLYGGKKTQVNDGGALGGSRQRTAIGFKKNGTMCIYCEQKPTKRPSELQQLFLDKGCDTAIMLDGGGSTQIDSNYSDLTSARRVHNYICIWEDAVCSFKEPTTVVKLGTKGESAKWVQWYLDEIMDSKLVIDGSFGPASVTALKSFQKRYGLTADGMCGPATRKVMKSIYNSESKDPKYPVCPYSEPTLTICQGSVGNGAKWVQWHLVELDYRDSLGRVIDVDGSFGPKSVQALKKFQKSNGLVADGVCGKSTIKKLKEVI